MAAQPGSLHAADYVIFVGMLIITLGIGIYHAWASAKKKTTSEYLVGSRNLRTLPVSLSLMASFISSILMLGFPAETYTGGIVVWWQFLGICFGALMSVIIFVPTLHPLKLTSVNQVSIIIQRSTTFYDDLHLFNDLNYSKIFFHWISVLVLEVQINIHIHFGIMCQS